MNANLDNEKFSLKLIATGKLKVTKTGRAFNLVTGKELAKPKSDSYRKLSWKNPETQRVVQVQLHRIVWAAFKGVPKDSELEVNHKDGVKSNCRLTNLELGTPQHNTKHANQTGLSYYLKGDEQASAVFTDDEVIKYRNQVKLGKTSCSRIAAKHNCSKTTVSYMLNKKTYTHV